jgi:hypothetical protein
VVCVLRDTEGNVIDKVGIKALDKDGELPLPQKILRGVYKLIKTKKKRKKD